MQVKIEFHSFENKKIKHIDSEATLTNKEVVHDNLDSAMKCLNTFITRFNYHMRFEDVIYIKDLNGNVIHKRSRHKY